MKLNRLLDRKRQMSKIFLCRPSPMPIWAIYLRRDANGRLAMQVFAKRFYGFDPARRPIIGFGMEGNRDALIATSRPGDLLVFVGTKGEPTKPEERGKLLGIVEFARIPVDATDVVDPAVLEPHDFRTDGTLFSAEGSSDPTRLDVQ